MAPIITISGASGSGKSFLTSIIKSEFPFIQEIVGITTRKIRDGEINGQSSYFITLEEFDNLEKNNKLILVKSFFGNKYAWLKDDFINNTNIKIMNVSYTSIEELKSMNLDIFSLFIRPKTEQQLIEALSLRCSSNEEFQKRLKDYAESENYLKHSNGVFDLIFTNNYDELSSKILLQSLASSLKISYKQKDLNIDTEIEKLIICNQSLDNEITSINTLLNNNLDKGDKKNDKK